MKKRILSMVLAIAVIASLMVIPAFASTTASDGHVYFYNDFSDAALPTGFTTTRGVLTQYAGEDVIMLHGANLTEAVDKLNTPVVTNVNATSSNPLEGLNDLVFEYRVNIPADNENYSYLNSSASLGGNYANLVFMAAPSYKIANKIAWSQTTAATPAAEFDTLATWHTISIVYKNQDTNTRHLYVDGVYYGESTDTTVISNKVEVENTQANVWAQKGKSAWTITLYSKKGVSEAYVDYVKAYEAPSSVVASIENANATDRNYITLKFNNAYGADTLKSENFNISDGTETVAVNSFERVDPYTFKLFTEKTLKGNTSYTLTMNGVKDNLANAVSNNVLSFVTSEEISFIDEETYYYNTFEGTNPGLSYYLTSKEVDYRNEITEDGKSVFTVQGLNVNQNAGNPDFRTTPVKFSEADAPNELVLEYRLRLNAPTEYSYLGIWANDKATEPRSRTVALGRYLDSKDKVFFHYTDKKPITDDFTVDTSKWTTVTIVYPKDVQKRKVYVNGTYLGESPEGKLENTYAWARETAFTMLPDFKVPEDKLEVDYIKYTNKPAEFNARILEAKSTGVIVEFNSTPINPELLAFTDGTAVKEIKEINEKTFVVIPEAPLAAGANNLSVSGIKDTIGNAIIADTVAFNIANSSEQVYRYSTFTETKLPTGFSFRNANMAGASPLDGSGLFTINLYSASTTDYSSILNVSNVVNPNATAEDAKANLPELVFEYRGKFSHRSGTSNENQTYHHYHNAEGQANMITYGATSYCSTTPKTGDEVKWNLTSAKEDVIGYVDVNDWHTYAIVYSNKANVRSLYIDGEYMGTSPVTDNVKDNPWYSAGKVSFALKLYSKVDNAKGYYDYIKAYTPADEINASFISVSDDAKKVTVSFDGNVAKLEPEMVKVAGQYAESVEVIDIDNNIFEVTFARKLPSSRTLDMIIDGALSTTGKKITDVLTFTTSAAGEYNVVVSGKDSENGRVIVAETATEDEDLSINVKANINYTATVKADGWVLEPDKQSNYIVRNATADTEITVEFAETVLAEKASSNKIPNVLETYSYGTATWAYGTLRKEATDFGFIAAKTSADLNMEAVEAGRAIKMPVESYNTFGEFGLMIIDKNNKFGGAYYVMPYAVYENIGTVYGTAVYSGHKK